MTALYLDVKKDLLDKITSGEYPEGTIIPTEHELSDIYRVSRPTIRCRLSRKEEKTWHYCMYT